MEAEIHIAGVLVQIAPGRALAAAAALAGLPGTEVRAMDEAGKAVVVCECASAEETFELMRRMRDLPDVVDVALVYQHAESATAMHEEIDHETDAT